jgi:Peptidase family M23/Secretion system C-terminal sorting domain/CARDB
MKKTFIFFVALIAFVAMTTTSVFAQLNNFSTGTPYTSYSLAFTNTIFGQSYTSMPSNTATASTSPGFVTGEFNASGSAFCAGSCTSNCIHKGLDQRCTSSTSLYSPISGVIVASGGSLGQVGIYNSTHNLTFHFLHLSSVAVAKGTNVTVGQYVGNAGSMGASAVHCHTEIRSGNTASAALPCGTNSNYDPRIIVALMPANLTLVNTVSISPTPIVQNQNVSVTANLKNTGGAFTGQLSAALHNSSGAFVGDIEVKSGVNLAAGASANYTFSKSISSAAGSYNILLKFNNGSGWTTISTTPVTISAPANPPLNDEPCGAITIPVTGANLTTTNVSATTSSSPSAPTSCGLGSGKDVWFKFVAPSNGIITARTNAGTLTSCSMALYSGSNCNNLSGLVCGTIPTMAKIYRSGLVPNTTYYLRVWNPTSATGTFSLNIVNYSALKNDDANEINSNSVRLTEARTFASKFSDGEAQLKISPNPTTIGSVNVNYTAIESEKEGLFFLYDLAGRVVFSKSTEINTGINDIKLNMDNLPKGMYVLTLRTNTAITTSNLVIE